MTLTGVLVDYFSAGTDEEAEAVIDRLGGPGAEGAVSPPGEPKRGIFGRQRRPAALAIDTRPDLVVCDTVSAKEVDPVVQLETFEELPTGRPYDDIVDDPGADML